MREEQGGGRFIAALSICLDRRTCGTLDVAIFRFACLSNELCISRSKLLSVVSEPVAVVTVH